MKHQLDYEKFIHSQESGECPKITIPLSLNTPHLQRKFNLDILVWNLATENSPITMEVVDYVLEHFDKLFETAWTSLYHYLCPIDPNVASHTLQEFYEQQIDFESPYYSIQLEINSEHLSDGIPRYCFVVSTVCSYKKWMISDDNMRVYMLDNEPCGANTNNDSGQILEEPCDFLYGHKEMFSKAAEKMKQDDFQYAKPFCK